MYMYIYIYICVYIYRPTPLSSAPLGLIWRAVLMFASAGLAIHVQQRCSCKELGATQLASPNRLGPFALSPFQVVTCIFSHQSFLKFSINLDFERTILSGYVDGKLLVSTLRSTHSLRSSN